MNTHYISSSKLDLSTVETILNENSRLALSDESIKRIEQSRRCLDKKLAENRELFYGINTGFGALHNIKISQQQLQEIQENLLKSHACGTGDEVPNDIVKTLLLLKIHSLALGYSGVSLDVVERLVDLYNHNIIPVVYQQGSLGASGDLVPLAHLSLPLIGLGEVCFKNKKTSGVEALRRNGLKPVRLKPKDGLALLNGTQFMSAYGIKILLKAQRLARWADFISALSVDAYDAKTEPFDPLLYSVRQFDGQKKSADAVLSALKGSAIAAKKKSHVQDPYSFRCIPQVHGASSDAIEYAGKVFLTEINSVTDNPVIFPVQNKILSGGNFHGQPLALALDFLCIALSELGSISERRTFQLISGQRGLPLFLTKNPGPHSGFMVPQYTAASIASQNKQLCTPASVDSIVSSNGQEDHVSMGANAALKCCQVVNNLERILAIELFTAIQALEFRRPLQSSPTIEKLIAEYRKRVPFIEKDTVMSSEIEKSIRFLRDKTPVVFHKIG